MNDAVRTGALGLLVIVVSGGVVSTVKVREGAGLSTLPATSVARTASVWLPSLSALRCSGDVHAAKAAPSRLQANVEPSSLALNVTSSEEWLSGVVIAPSVVTGGVVSPCWCSASVKAPGLVLSTAIR